MLESGLYFGSQSYGVAEKERKQGRARCGVMGNGAILMVEVREIKHGTHFFLPSPHPILTPPEFHGYGAPSPLVVGTYTATQYLSPGFVFFVVRRPLPLSSGTDSKEKAL